MIPPKIINKAIEGGWKNYWTDGGVRKFNFYAALLDSTFWVALEKGLGKEKECFTSAEETDTMLNDEYVIPWWRAKAYEFYKLNLTGGDLEAYWKELLDNK